MVSVDARREAFERAKPASTIERVTLHAWRTIQYGATIGVQLALRRADGSFKGWQLTLGGVDDSTFSPEGLRRLRHLCRAVGLPVPSDAAGLEAMLNDLIDHPRTAQVDLRGGTVFWFPRHGRAA